MPKITYIEHDGTEHVIDIGGPSSEAEEELLQGAAAEVKPTSRLSCQIIMSDTLDGLVVHLPEKQYD